MIGFFKYVCLAHTKNTGHFERFTSNFGFMSIILQLRKVERGTWKWAGRIVGWNQGRKQGGISIETCDQQVK